MDKVNILLVDDQPAKLLTYEATLASLDENLIKATSAREALTHLLKMDVAVVLMDVNMPDVDGFELAALMREHPRCDRTAIIFVSAVYLSDMDRMRAYKTGAVDYVSVPIVPELLRAKISVFVDLYRKTAELERLNRGLEERVSSRTAELRSTVERLTESERRLRIQGAQLMEIDRRRNEFLAMLGHELRNPLQSIRSANELSRLPGRSAAQDAWCRDVVSRQVDQLVRLVDDLLDASRVSNGKLTLQMKPLAVADPVLMAIEAMRPGADRSKLKIDVRTPTSPAFVQGDVARLTQVFTNLLSNAIKFSREGGRVSVSIDHAGPDVTIRVADEGEGIPSDELEHVFDMFFQGMRKPDERAPGLGIGLALVRQIVELHGGTVTAASEGAGRGSEFVVRLPAIAAAASVEAKTGDVDRDASPHAPLRLLVVDDNRDAAEALAQMLRSVNHDVRAVFDGAEAVAAVAHFRPHVVLMDLAMPNMDGYQAARAMRASPQGRGLVLVAVSGFGGDAERAACEAAGFDRHLVKPVAHADVVTLVEALHSKAAQASG